MQATLKILPLLLIAAILTSGCDFVRSALNKPTSADLELLRQENEARQKAYQDSVAAAKAEKEKMEAEKKAAPVLFKYYVVAGSYKETVNADRCAETLRKDGYEVTRFKFRNGFDVVAILGTDDLNKAYRSCSDYTDVCPEEVEPWVYNTGFGYHE